jgi:hypothetical protein
MSHLEPVITSGRLPTASSDPRFALSSSLLKHSSVLLLYRDKLHSGDAFVKVFVGTPHEYLGQRSGVLSVSISRVHQYLACATGKGYICFSFG